MIIAVQEWRVAQSSECLCGHDRWRHLDHGTGKCVDCERDVRNINRCRQFLDANWKPEHA